MKAEENLKTKATCAQMQYLQKVQRILSQLKAKCRASMKKDQKRCCGNTSKKNIQSRKG